MLPRIARDPVLVGMGLLALAIVPWFLAGPGGPGSSWLIQTGLDVSLVVFARRLTALSPAERIARRFWRAMSVAGLLCAVGDGCQSVQVLRDPADTRTSLAQTLPVVAGMSVMAVTMLRHPLGSAGRQRLRLWLDAATVLVGVAVFLWYFSLGAQLGSARMADRLAAAASSIVMLVIVFGVLKLILGGTAPFTRAAGLAAALGVTGTALSTSVGIILTGGSNPGVETVAQLLPCVLAAASLRLQELQMRDPAGLPRRRRRRFSLLPYAAVVATQLLMVAALYGSGPSVRLWGVAIGVVVITGLVLGRQLAAFQDNDRLLTSLDRSLLELHSQKEWFRSLVQHASDLTLVVDARDAVAYAGPAVSRVLGIDPQAAVGLVVEDLVHPGDRAAFAALADRLAAEPGADASAQVRLRHADGSHRWLDVVGVDLRGNRSVRGIVYNARDITEAHDLQEELRHRATHDALTGLANRARLAELPAAATFSILVLDLDGFKQVNDVHGHHVGDELLIAVARRLTEHATEHTGPAGNGGKGGTGGPGGIAVRLGGDEFALLLPDADPARAHRVAAAIVAELGEPLTVAGRQLHIGASVGVATGTAGDLDRLLRDADAEMYRVKRGRALSSLA